MKTLLSSWWSPAGRQNTWGFRSWLCHDDNVWHTYRQENQGQHSFGCAQCSLHRMFGGEWVLLLTCVFGQWPVNWSPFISIFYLIQRKEKKESILVSKKNTRLDRPLSSEWLCYIENICTSENIVLAIALFLTSCFLRIAKTSETLGHNICFQHFWFFSDPSPIIGYACHSLTH